MQRTLLVTLMPILLAACGGGGGGANQQNTAPTPAAAAVTAVPAYHFVAPKAGLHLAYAASQVDNLGNTVNRTITDDVTALNADGSFTVHEEDPSHDTIVSGATDQTVYPTDFQYNAAGQSTVWTIVQPSGSLRCEVSGGAAGAPAQLVSGADWNTSYTETCGSGPGTAYMQSGTLAGIESVTVPAGTFNAYKFVATTSRALNGITRTETSTRWRDSAGADSRTIKEAAVFTYSGGTPPAGSLLQTVRQLQSVR